VIGEGYRSGGGPPLDLFFGQSDPMTAPFLVSSFPRCRAERGGILIFRGGLAVRMPSELSIGPEGRLASDLSSGREAVFDFSPWSDNPRPLGRPRVR
jgi:hypothetical protein